MIEVNGLSDSIFEAMMINAQNKIVQDIMNAASVGKTSVVVKEKRSYSTVFDAVRRRRSFSLRR